MVDRDELVDRYTDLAVRQCHGLYLQGAERADLEQEAMVGLLEAIRAYDPALEIPFGAFAQRVVRRRVLDAVTKSRAIKHRLLTEADRVYTTDDGDDVHEGAIVDLIPAHMTTEEMFERSEEIRTWKRVIKTGLTELEHRAFLIVANDQPVQINRVRNKPVENALDRVRRKLRKAA